VNLVRRALLLAALMLVSAATVAWLFGGFRLTAGPLRVSFANPARIAFEASLLWLLGALVHLQARRAGAIIALALAAVVVSAILDSSPRRVGDGAEYVAMALNMSRARPPAVTAAERKEIQAELERLRGYEYAPLDQPLVGRDGRQDFYHFWLYPLCAVPFTILLGFVQAHPNTAFTLLNLAVLGALTWMRMRDGEHAAAAMLIAGPILWWVDKAHAEVFLFVMLSLAVLLIERAPVISLLSAGLAAAQNPAACVVLAACAVAAVASRRSDPVPLVAPIAAATGIAAVHPLYYRWHLGTWSPLGAGLAPAIPGLRSVLTPVLDPNLGLLVHAPVLCVLAVAGSTVRSHSPVQRLVIAASTAALLLIFAQEQNVNHGGSPGISRYALWLIALWTPLITVGHEVLRQRTPRLTYVLAAVSILMSTYLFRPLAAARDIPVPNRLSTWLWRTIPAIDNPLPEIFAERVTGIDGMPTVPSTTRRCEKILTAGNGRDAMWPMPCRPRELPTFCAREGALCYVNGSQVVPAPTQASFGHVDDPARWTLTTTGRLQPIVDMLGVTQLERQNTEIPRWLRQMRGVRSVSAVSGPRGWATWIRYDAHEAPTITVRLERPMTLTWFDPNDPSHPERSIRLGDGNHVIRLLPRLALLVFQRA
jgi:hypothetical protein